MNCFGHHQRRLVWSLSRPRAFWRDASAIVVAFVSPTGERGKDHRLAPWSRIVLNRTLP